MWPDLGRIWATQGGGKLIDGVTAWRISLALGLHSGRGANRCGASVLFGRGAGRGGARQEGKIATVVGTVTDDKRLYDMPKLTVSGPQLPALRATATAEPWLASELWGGARGRLRRRSGHSQPTRLVKGLLWIR